MSEDDRLLGRGRHLDLIDRDGWEFVSRRRGREVVGIVAWTRDDRLLLVEQNRPAVGGRTIELPAGLVGDEAGCEEESLERAAERELLEETGHAADHWTRLARGPASSGLASEMVTLLVAHDLRRVAEGGGVGDERIVVHEVPRHGLDEWLASRESDGLVVDIKVPMAKLVPAVRDPGTRDWIP